MILFRRAAPEPGRSSPVHQNDVCAEALDALPRENPVRLPPQQAEKPLEVIIRPDRTLALIDRAGRGGERAVTREELVQAVLAAQARNPDQPVLISGDRSVKYEAVLEVMDALQRQQVKRVALNVQISAK